VRSVSAANADGATNAQTATNATQLGGVAASQYVQTNDSRLSDLRSPTPGSANYIQTNPSAAQNANFNITGAGSVGGTLSGSVVNAATQFNIGGIRVFGVSGTSQEPNSNTFAGDGAGGAITPLNDGSGSGNSFFGKGAGQATSTGFSNSFFGINAGHSNVSSGGNAFFGFNAGLKHTSGIFNAFFGADAGQFNQSGANNTAIGGFTDVGLNLNNATAIGAGARVDQSDSLVLGSINGVNQATADTNVGIGTTTPRSALEVKRNWDGSFGAITVTGDRPTIRFSGGAVANNDQWILHLGSAAGTSPAGSLSFFFGGTAGTSFGSNG